MKKLHLLCLLFLLVIVSACKKESEIETDLQPNNIGNTFILNQISGPSADEINLRTYTSSQAADFFSLDFISSSSDLARARNEVNPFLLKANEILYKNTTQEQLELLIKSIGYPAWDIGRVSGLYNDYGYELVYVPTFEEDKKTIKSLIYFEFTKEETVFVRIYNAKLYTLIYQQYPDDPKAAYIHSFFDYFMKQQELSAQTRTDCGDGTCAWQETTWGRQCLQQFNGAMTTAGTPCPDNCCNEVPQDQGNEHLADWFETEITPFIRFPYQDGTGGGSSINNPVSEIINTSDEQAIIAHLMECFEWDATHPNLFSLITFPNYMRAIIQHVGLNCTSETHLASVQRFIDFMNNHGLTAGLSYPELITLIGLPQGIGKLTVGWLNNYLTSQNTDATSVFVLHELLRLAATNPNLPSTSTTILDNFYRMLTPEVKTWIEGSDDNFRRFLNLFLIDGPSEKVEERRKTATRVLNLIVEHDLDFDSETFNFLLNNLQKATEVYIVNEPEEENVTDFLEPCPSSFNFTSTGAGGSTNLNCIKYGAIYAQLVAGPYPESIEYKCYELPDLCIATGGFELDDWGDIIEDDNGNPIPISNNTRKYFTAIAMSFAYEEITKANISALRTNDPYLTQLEANDLFREAFEDKLKEHLTGVTISSGGCNGNINTSIPEYSIFGVCLPFSCEC